MLFYGVCQAFNKWKKQRDFKKYREDLASEHEASMEKFAKKLRDVQAALKELRRRKVHMDRYYLETKGEKVVFTDLFGKLS